MALTALEINTITKAIQTAKKILSEVQPVLSELNIIYDSAGGAKTTIDQAGLNSVSAFSGLTKAQLDDGLYCLTATLRSAILNGYSALAELSARSDR